MFVLSLLLLFLLLFLLLLLLFLFLFLFLLLFFCCYSNLRGGLKDIKKDCSGSFLKFVVVFIESLCGGLIHNSSDSIY